MPGIFDQTGLAVAQSQIDADIGYPSMAGNAVRVHHLMHEFPDPEPLATACRTHPLGKPQRAMTLSRPFLFSRMGYLQP